jgi:hypothetical protein
MYRGILLSLLVCLAVALPYQDKMTLTNSLIVGRDDAADLYDWTCKVCDASNKPIHAHIIEEKAVDIKSILSVYPEFMVLAFRYTNTALNVWQDILSPLQVPPASLRLPTSTPSPTARCRRPTTHCGSNLNCKL